MHWSGVSVVIPVFQSVETLPELVERIDLTLAALGNYEVIFVDDGSAEATWSAIVDLSTHWPQVAGVRLGRNYGQHNALVAGIRAASMPITVTIDDDLQNPPEEIPLLVNALVCDDLDVVYGVPERPAQTLPRQLAGRIIRNALKRGLSVESAPTVSSFRAFRTTSRNAFARDLGSNVSLDALLTWGSKRYGSVTVRHDPRTVGTSNYTVSKLLKFAIDTTTGYSTVPLQAASVLGLATALFGLAIIAFVVGRLIITGESVPGFPFLAASIAIFAGVQLLTLGIIGEYLARMHFRVMGKPTYVICETTRDLGPQL